MLLTESGSLSAKQWFIGKPYIDSANSIIIGYDAINGRPEYKASASVVIRNNGKVGIGVFVPSHLLHLSSSDSDVNLMVETSKANGRAQIRFKNDVQEYVTGCSTNDDYLVFDANNNKTPFLIEPGVDNHTLYLDSTDRVGIGTNSPAKKLDVNGNIQLGDAGTNSNLNFNSSENGRILINDAVRISISSSGNIGIGTSTPGRKLTVAGSDNLAFFDSTGNAYVTIDRSGANRRSALVFSTGGNGTSNIPDGINWALGSADSDEVGDGSGFFIGKTTNANNAKMFITSTGNVGIGTLTPSEELTVAGTISGSGNLKIDGSQVDFTNLPTSDPGVAGRLYRSGNDLKISTG